MGLIVHIRYIKILIWLRGFLVIFHNLDWFSLCWSLFWQLPVNGVVKIWNFVPDISNMADWAMFEGRLVLILGFMQCRPKRRLHHLYTRHTKCSLDGDRCEEVQLYLHRGFLLRFKWELDRDRVRYQFRDCASDCTTPRDSWPRTTAFPNIHGSSESSCESDAEREKPRVYMFRV